MTPNFQNFVPPGAYSPGISWNGLHDPKIRPLDPFQDGDWNAQWSVWWSRAYEGLRVERKYQKLATRGFGKGWKVSRQLLSSRRVQGTKELFSDGTSAEDLAPTLVILVERDPAAAANTPNDQDRKDWNKTLELMRRLLDKCDKGEAFELNIMNRDTHDAIWQWATDREPLKGTPPTIM